MSSIARKFQFLLALSLLILSARTSSDNKKKYSKHSVYKQGSCSTFDHSSKIIELERDFMQFNSKSSDHLNLGVLSSVLQDDEDEIKEQCGRKLVRGRHVNSIRIKFRYQFIESLHCVRVELNLGNVTKFTELTNFKYYMFSYRELTKTNNYLKRHVLNESTNSLVVYKAHLKPYIICVTFYKQKYKSSITKNDNFTNSTASLDCSEFNEFIMNDERTHDIDLCIDIDTQLHFLSQPPEHEEFSLSQNRELLMVVFIVCLLAVILLLITAGHYIIEKPKKRRVLQALRTYLQKKTHGQTDNSTNLINNSSLALFPNQRESRSANGPSITVTDFSSSNTLNGNSKTSNNDESEPKESDPMLSPAKSDHWNSLQYNDHASHKVTFSIGETIYEEPATFNDTVNEVNEDAANSNPNEDAVKSVSHLLDDKPWITSPAPSASCSRMSRNNSITSQNPNNH